MIRLLSATSCLAVLLLCGTATGGDKDVPKQPAKGEKQLTDYLAGRKAGGGQVVPLTAEPLAKTFSDYNLFAVRFRQFPVARVMPEGMKASNIFAVKGDKVEQLKTPSDLEKFFRANATPVKEEKDATPVVQSWLTLTQEFIQDGFYKFDVSKDVTAKREDGRLNASGREVVMAGGNGAIDVTLTFDKDGKLEKVVENAKIRPGPRPICQATKLLDTDLIVRRMAEQDLLYMGLAARDYLMEQRSRATPELRQAIDRLWQRIEKEAW